jgi:hypothetical protein
MTVEETRQIDLTTTRDGSDDLSLIISDHLSWKKADEGQHLVLLQAKIYAYLDFIDSGELTRKIPSSAGKRISIVIHSKYPPSEQGKRLFAHLRNYVSSAGYELDLQLAKEGARPKAK